MTTHDWMFCVDLVQRAALIVHVGSEEMSRQLIFQGLDTLPIRIAKEKPDHPIVEHPVNKSINDHSKLLFAADLLKKSLVHGDEIQRFVEVCAQATPHPRLTLHHAQLQPSGFGHFARIPWRIPY